MALGMNLDSKAGGSAFLPFAKYDAKAGRMFRIDRGLDADGRYANAQVDITSNFKAVIDMENIEVGWINFPSGAAPQFALALIGQGQPVRPSQDFKQGARLLMKLHKDCGGDMREFSSTSRAFLNAFNAVHDAYLAGVKDNPGKLPIVAMTSTQPVVTVTPKGKITNYAPVFDIVGWAPRPIDLVYSPRDVPTAAVPSVSPPATGSTPVGPPQKAAPAPQPATAGDDDFG